MGFGLEQCFVLLRSAPSDLMLYIVIESGFF